MDMDATTEAQGVLHKKADILGITHFLVCYSGLTCDTRAVLVPASAIRRVQKLGCGSHPHDYYGLPGHSDGMYFVPDEKTLIQLPWKPEIGWVMSDVYRNGEPFSSCPRHTLARLTEKARQKGYSMKSGVEIEFQLLKMDGSAIGDDLDTMRPSFQEPESLMRRASLIMEISKIMDQLGWGPYQLQREEVPGQFELNFGYADAMTTSDRHIFFKFMVKELAEANGYRATFMPVPLKTMTQGNGAHCNVSLWERETDTNIFPDKNEEMGLSKEGQHFLGGLLSHAVETTALMCPTVNSYKRMNLANWSPRSLTYGGDNKTVLIRVPPGSERLEHRLPDSTANPYLVHAAVIAAGLDGIKHEIELGPPCLDDAGTASTEREDLPRNLLDALRALDRSEFMRSNLGSDLIDGFVKLRRQEWDEYMLQVTDWEIQRYIGC